MGGVGFAERRAGPVEDDVEISDGDAHASGAFFSREILKESELKRLGVAGVERRERPFDLRAGVFGFKGVGGVVGAFGCDAGLSLERALQTTGALVGAVYVGGAVDRDASQPEVDALVVLRVVLLDAFEHRFERVAKHVLGLFPVGQPGQDDLAEQRRAVPDVQRRRGRAIPLTQPFHDGALFR